MSQLQDTQFFVTIERVSSDGSVVSKGTFEVEVVRVFKCDACDTVDEATAELPLRECPECGELFNENAGDGDEGNKCPSCGKRGKKVAEDSCAHCDAGEVHPFDAVQCPVCDDWVDADDYPTHVEQHLLGT